MNRHEIPELDRKGLRNFGLMFAAFVVLVFGFVLPWLAHYTFPVWPWIVAAGFAAWALIAPGSIKRFYHLWMRVGMTIGHFVTTILLGLVFYGVVLPIAVLFRIKGTDPMARKLDRRLASYRVESKKASKNDLERPF